MKIKCNLLVLFIGTTITGNAQIMNQKISAATITSFTNGNVKIDYSIARVLPSSMNNEAHLLNNGLRQATISVSNITEAVGNISFNVFPNPILQTVTRRNNLD